MAKNIKINLATRGISDIKLVENASNSWIFGAHKCWYDKKVFLLWYAVPYLNLESDRIIDWGKCN